VQPVHNQHDRTRQLVVEPAVKGVVVPLIGSLALGLRQRLLGLQRVVDLSIIMISAPGPVSTPPTEVAMRKLFLCASEADWTVGVDELGSRDAISQFLRNLAV
jgi:hypothetical protein